ncbi:protein of unknown function (DUF1080) [Abditibacterium utsteinense]|uniref:Uncharacterized protein n=1 Tax=Abditibacterium utsteinense TaxID=1960156 RepID=A0A2S8SRS9_9BACT|nr:beta-L-arabinofuranosidase domain-containing protein [Abditibacterium utsteinense]PQV63522.1 protein of unknown function (DUF1080) [Abditibacterium utsteinense]
MNQEFESNAPQQSASDTPLPTDESVAVSRRGFLSGSATLLGALLVSNEAARAAPMSATPASATALAPGQFAQLAASVANRAPLQSTPFHALPLGSVRARGWLLHQLELQRDGLTGHAEELLPATASDSAWKGGDGEDWEKGPYYLKGLVPLAYTLDDAVLKAKVQAWIEPILSSGREDGFFGPKKNDDWWPRMVATYLLRDYAEATGDARVQPFLTRYYRHMSEHLPTRALRDWGRARAGDEIDTVFWLYNRTGDEFLLPLADLLQQQAFAWTEIFHKNEFMSDDFMTRHNVNVPQALKMPAVYFQRSGAARDKTAYDAGRAHLMRDHGTSFGINTGTEMLAGRSSFEGVETCSIVEQMLSDETALRILGDARIGDNLETLAFNALPAATSKTFRQHVYYTLENNVTAPRSHLGYEQDYDDGRTPAPRSGFPCCCYNLHMGWPKLAQSAWAATRNGGLALLAYVPSQVTARVGEAAVRFECETNYPFEDTIRLRASSDRAARFDLQLRIPAWCQKAQIKVNGKVQPTPVAGTFAIINRTWKSGDLVEISLPSQVEVMRGVNDSVSVRRGPLVYALGIQENWKPFDQAKIPGFESFEVLGNSAWNFALALSSANPAAAFQLTKKAVPRNPFQTGQSPLALRVTAKRLPTWTLQPNGAAAFDPPLTPVQSDAPLQTLELVPFGSQMLRVTNFPVIGAARPRLTQWRDDLTSGHADNWVFYGGGWFVREARLRAISPREGVKAIVPSAQFSDVSFEADVVVGATGNAGLLLRAARPSIGADAFDGYYVGISAADGRVILGKSNQSWTEIATAPARIEADKSTRLRVEARGDLIRVWIGDAATPAIEARDSQFASGALGVRHYSTQPDKARAEFGNLSAKAL